MTDERRRRTGPAPPPPEPSPSETLPFAPTAITPPAEPRAPALDAQQLPYAPTVTPALDAQQLPYAPTVTPALEAQYAPTVTPALERGNPLRHAGPATPVLGPDTRDLRGRVGLGPSGTLDLPASDRVVDAGSLDPGQMIGHFVIRARLGEGGMGVVLAGHDADLGRPVAIKLVKAEFDDPGYRARLLREAQAMARLEHPNVVRVYEVGSDRGRLFVAMELVDGVTLTAWLRAQRRAWRDVVALFLQIGRGLAAVHRVGLIHRDFKPDNVLVDRDGRARVADFGLARLDREQVASTGSPELAASLTRTGMMMGTPGYMAPEQQFGADVDARADQYSFCVALREALVGGRSVAVDDPRWTAIPRPLRQAISRGLAYDAAERFASMDVLLFALEEAAARRRSMAIAAVAIALVVIGGGVAVAVTLTGDGATGGDSSVASAPGASAGSASTSGSGSARAATGASAGSASTSGAGSAHAASAGSAGSASTSNTADEPSGVRTALAGSGADDARTGAKAAPSSDARTGAKASPSSDARSGAKAPPSSDARSGTKVSPSSGARPSSDRAKRVAEAPPRPPGGTEPAAEGSSAEAAPPPPVPPPGAGSAVPPRKPAATVGDPGHLPVVRATIRDLGYDGYDAKTTQADVDAASGLDRAVAIVKLGMIERRKGQCGAANKHFQDAVAALKWPGDGDEGLWAARAYTGLALCALGAGTPALEHAQRAFLKGNQDQMRLAIALAFYESGNREVAHQMMVLAQTLRDPFVKPALQAWLSGTGLTL